MQRRLPEGPAHCEAPWRTRTPHAAGLPLPRSAGPATLRVRRVAATMLAVLLAGCGSGGGDEPESVAPAAIDASSEQANEAAGTTPAIAESRAPAASSTPTAQRVPSAPVNSIDTIVADMRGMNDAVLRGYEDRTRGWYVGPGSNQMGSDARTSNAAAWFRDQYPWFVSGTPMRALLPWLVIFDGVSHAADNTRVQVRDMRAYWKSRSNGAWHSWGRSPGVSGSGVPKHGLFGSAQREDKRVLADGSVEIRPPSDPQLAWHGWWNLGRVWIDPQDVAAVFFTLQARLVVDDPRRDDDRPQAQLMVQVGADYYPDLERGWPGPNPAVATSRAKRVGAGWQAFNMVTLIDVGLQDPGAGITEAVLRAVPPPLE